jgi:hypothetical protein
MSRLQPDPNGGLPETPTSSRQQQGPSDPDAGGQQHVPGDGLAVAGQVLAGAVVGGVGGPDRDEEHDAVTHPAPASARSPVGGPSPAWSIRCVSPRRRLGQNERAIVSGRTAQPVDAASSTLTRTTRATGPASTFDVRAPTDEVVLLGWRG